MKILILADMPAPYRVDVFKGIAKEHCVDVFFKTCEDEARNAQWFVTPEASLHFHVLNSKESQKIYRACIKNIKAYDVVLCYDPWPARARKLQRLCRRNHIPYALNADGAVDINMSFPKKQIKTFYTKRAPLCLAGCQKAAAYFKAYGAQEKHIVRHPFSSLHEEEIERRLPTADEKSAVKKQLGMTDKTTFLAVGQFIHRKGFDLLLDAWGKANCEGQLYIIGGGPSEALYRRMIEKKGLQNVYILDYKRPAELRPYFLASDVFVMPTREDIWGLVINEAMAVGLPIITSDRCTAGVELITHGQSGYIYPCEDASALAQHIKVLYSHPDMRHSFSENVLRTIQKYTIENIVQSHLASLRMLKNKGKTS